MEWTLVEDYTPGDIGVVYMALTPELNHLSIIHMGEGRWRLDFREIFFDGSLPNMCSWPDLTERGAKTLAALFLEECPTEDWEHWSRWRKHCANLSTHRWRMDLIPWLHSGIPRRMRGSLP